MTRTIEVTISRTGETKVETKGFTGAECQQASQFIEKTLGQRIAESLTAEFHSAQQAEQQHQQN